MDKYIPPYDITEEMLGLTSEITEELGKLSGVDDLERSPRLRRVNRLRSIQSSLAIENNTLSLEQVTDVIEGKRVLGPQDDILAVDAAENEILIVAPLYRGVVQQCLELDQLLVHRYYNSYFHLLDVCSGCKDNI